MINETQESQPLTQEDQSHWESDLKLGLDMAMPILTLVFGILILRITKKLERSQWRSQKVIEKRITEWDSIRIEFNQIFCYCTRVGDWKSLKPTDVIELKRVADRKVHLARPYFTKSFFSSYLQFIKTCFEQYQGHGVDAKIKSPLWEHQNALGGVWDQSWDKLFLEDVDTDESEKALWESYEKMLEKVAEELETRHG